MAETKDTHFVVIPVDDDHNQKKQIAVAAHNHPLSEISRSPGHFLLLKLLQREENLHGRRILRKESRKDAFAREAFHLCCSFFVFHGLFFTVLFSSSASSDRRGCRNWWVPCAVSAGASLALASLVQAKLLGYWKADGQLQRYRAEGRAHARCVQELRMKGASFDLGKGPTAGGKRMKSSSVEVTWVPLAWGSRYRVTALLLCFSGLVLPACRFVLCG